MRPESNAGDSAPWVQIAIDTRSSTEASRLSTLAVDGGATWLEVGTPLIVFEGVKAIEVVVGAAQGRPVVADFKAVDGVAKYFAEASELGAALATVLGAAPNASIRAAVSERDKGGCSVIVDLYGLKDRVTRAREVADMGADFVMLHVGFDEISEEPHRDPLESLDELVEAVDLPVGVATFTVEQAIDAVSRGASWIVQGEPLISAQDPGTLIAEFVERVRTSAG